MIVNEVEQKAAVLRGQHGGTIFAFPIHEEDPYSEYAVVVYAGGKYHIYPNAADISLAALGIKTILEKLKKNGDAIDYAQDVRFISYDAQINAPSVTMRRLKNDPSTHQVKGSRPILQKDVDVEKNDVDGGYTFTARGIIKFSYLEMVDKNPKGAQFMNEYYKLLSMRKYGKTASAISQEVRRMSKDEAIQWIERTYSKYIHDDVEVINIVQNLR